MTALPETGLSNIRRIWRNMTPRRKRQLGLLIVLLVSSVLSEAATLTMVIPLVNALAQPHLVPDFLLKMLNAFGGRTEDQLRMFVAGIFVGLVLISAAVRLLYLWASTRLAFAIGSDFTEMAFRKTLALPYEEQTRQNSSNLLTSLMVKMQAIVFVGLMPMLSAFAATILALAIVATLFAITPGLTLVLVIMTLGLLAIVILALRTPLQRTGQMVARLQPQFTERMQVARGGIREIILDGTQEFFAHELSRIQYELRFHQARGAFLSTSPRFFMEVMFLLVILGLAFWTISANPDPVAAITSLSIVAFGAMKILPSAQLMVLNWATIRNGSPGVADALNLVELPAPPALSSSPRSTPVFTREIRLRDIWFRYGGEGAWILQGIDLTITKGERIGFVGETGAGKSTLIDLIMGLLTPERGTIEVDGVVLRPEDLFAWRRQVAHVPQSIYLTDASVAENIAFGLRTEVIQPERVVEAAHKASIASFVDDGNAGFATLVGERGVRLSGGQRQRIGIARALYKSADLIVLDEATSALDGETEARIMQTIAELGLDKTVIMIAHRLATLKDCDRIVEIEKGRVVHVKATGTADRLQVERRAMKNVQKIDK